MFYISTLAIYPYEVHIKQCQICKNKLYCNNRPDSKVQVLEIILLEGKDTDYSLRNLLKLLVLKKFYYDWSLSIGPKNKAL